MAKNQKVTVEPKTDEQTANIETLNATQAAPPVASAPTREDLFKIFTDTQADFNATVAAGNFVEIGKKSNALQAAIKALNAYDAKMEADKLAAEVGLKREANIDYLANAFGVPRETVISLYDADQKDANQPLRNAINSVFGGKVTVAKEGQSGKSLQATSGERGGKSKEILEKLQAGITRDELLELYPTENDPKKLNGTARTVISAGGWKIGNDGKYAQG